MWISKSETEIIYLLNVVRTPVRVQLIFA